MTVHELDAEEQDFLQSYERGEWQSRTTVKEELQHYQAYAATTMEKKRLVAIDLSAEDLAEIQQRALARGMPYQTLIANIVHEFVSGRLVEQS